MKSPMIMLSMLILLARHCECHEWTAAKIGRQVEAVINPISKGMDFDPVLVVSKAYHDLPGILSEKTADSKANRGLALFTPEATMDKFYPYSKDCSYDGNLDKLITKPKLIVTVLDSPQDVEMVLQGLKNTITNCSTYFKAGYYYPENVIVHFLTAANKNLSKIVFDDDESRRHKSVIVIQSLNNSERNRLMQFNAYKSKVHSSLIDLEEPPKKETLVKKFSMQGFQMRCAAMPYEHYVIGEIIKNEADPRKSLAVRGGMEVDMLNAIAESDGFSVEYRSPGDLTYGHMYGPRPTGVLAEILLDHAQVGIGAWPGSDDMKRAFRFAGSMSRGRFVIVSPMPRVDRSVMEIIRPLTFLSIAVVAAALTALVKVWEIAFGRKQRRSDSAETLWYTFGVFVGENVSLVGPTDQKTLWYLRVLCCCWQLCAFVITASYSGNLRSFLISPFKDSPVDTLEDLVDSDLAWRILHFEGFDVFYEGFINSTDPARAKFWQGRVEEDFGNFPYKQMMDVYEGNSAMLSWQEALDPVIRAAFTRPNGASLVHVAREFDLAMDMYTTLLFHPLNPWSDRIDTKVRRLVEAGVMGHLIEVNSKIVREANLASLQARNAFVPGMEIRQSDVDDDSATSLQFDQLLFAFLALVVALGIQTVVFAAEVGSKTRLLHLRIC